MYANKRILTIHVTHYEKILDWLENNSPISKYATKMPIKSIYFFLEPAIILTKSLEPFRGTKSTFYFYICDFAILKHIVQNRKFDTIRIYRAYMSLNKIMIHLYFETIIPFRKFIKLVLKKMF